MIQGPENFDRGETPEPKRRLSGGRRRSLQAVGSSAPGRSARVKMPAEGAYPAARSFSHLDSVQLLREFERTGNSAPFEEIVRRYTPVVFATCLRVTRDAHDAEDATQATFLTLAAKGRLNGEIHAPEAWLRKVGHRLSLDLIRSKKRRNNRENVRSKMTSEIRAIDSSQSADNSETKSILHEELAKLPAGYRMPLILHYFGGLSRDEMSDQLRIKPSTLGVRLHRAREQLKKRMARRGINMPIAALTIFLGEAVRQRIADSIVSQCSSSIASISTSNGFGSIGAMQSSMISSTLIANSVRDVLATVTTSKVKIGALVLMGMLSFGINAPSLAQLVPEGVIERIKQFHLRDFFTDFQPKLTKPMQVDVPRLVASNEPSKPIESIEPVRSIAQSNTLIYIPARVEPSPIVNDINPVVLASIGANDDIAPNFSVRLSAPMRIEPSSTITQQSITTHRSFAAVSSASPSRPTAKGNRVETSSDQIVPERSSNSMASSFRVGETRANGRRASDGKNVGAAIIALPGIESNSPVDPASVASSSNLDQAIPSTAVPPKPPKVVVQESIDDVATRTSPSSQIQTSAVPTGSLSSTPSFLVSTASNNSTSGGWTTTASSQPQTLRASEQNQYSISSINIEQTSRGARTGLDQSLPDESARVTETVRFNGTPDAFGGYDFAAMNADQLAEAAQVLASENPCELSGSAPINPFDTPSAANAVKVTLHDQTEVGSTIDFIKTIDTSSLGLPSLPIEHTFFGLWKLDSNGEFSMADIEVRYDDILANRLGLDEHWVKLWVCDGSNWNLLMNDPSFGRDTDRNLVWASASDFEYFAVSTPEPATLSVLFASALVAMRRRR